MMRASVFLGVLLVLLAGAYALRVNARPQKVDYLSGVCQKTSGGTVTYEPDGISVGTTATSVVCPLEHITFTDDTVGTSEVTFKAWVKYKLTAGVDSSCQLVSAGTRFASIPSFPSSLTSVSGTVAGTGIFSVPTNVDSTPTSFRVTCDFTGAAFLGAMQVKMIDHP